MVRNKLETFRFQSSQTQGHDDIAEPFRPMTQDKTAAVFQQTAGGPAKAVEHVRIRLMPDAPLLRVSIC